MGPSVSAYSKNPEAAFSYVAWFASPETARNYVVNGGGSSGRQSLLTDPEIVNANPVYPALLDGYKVYHPLPTLESYGYVDANIIPPYIQAAISGETSPKEALEKATEEAKNFLKDKGEIE
jgi:ABC-type glycerol-3-phosphate transport system substrate-binding protein